MEIELINNFNIQNYAFQLMKRLCNKVKFEKEVVVINSNQIVENNFIVNKKVELVYLYISLCLYIYIYLYS